MPSPPSLVLGSVRLSWRLPRGAADCWKPLITATETGIPRALERLVAAGERRDEPLHVIRRLRVRTHLEERPSGLGDVAEQWAADLAGAIAVVVLGRANDVEIRTFTTAADRLAECIVDHLEGRARGVWWYGGLGHHLAREPIGRAVAALLEAAGEALPRVLERLAALGRLEAALAVLERGEATALLRGFAGPMPLAQGPRQGADERSTDLRAWLPLLAAALRVLGDPDPVEAARGYLHRMAPRLPSPPRFDDRAALTETVLAMAARLLADSPALFRSASRDADNVRDAADLTWLDRERLACGLAELLLIAQGAPADASQTAAVGTAAGKGEALPTLRRHPDPRDAPAALARSATGPRKTSAQDSPENALTPSVNSPCAGLVLLLRALTDIGVGRLLARAESAVDCTPCSQRPWVAGVMLTWAGQRGLAADGSLDAGLIQFAGLDPGTRPDLLLGGLDPLLAEQLAELAGSLGHQKRLTRLEDALLARLSQPGVEPGLARLAARLLLAWAVWLDPPPTSGEALAELLVVTAQRPGRLLEGFDGGIVVELPPDPFDRTLERAGYLAPLSAIPWLDGASVEVVISNTER